MAYLARFVLGALSLLVATEARAADWVLWADGNNGVPPRTYPQIAISVHREIFLTYLAPQFDDVGVVYRASLDAPQFVQMPGFTVPTPPPNSNRGNVFSITTNARGEPIVGLSVLSNDNQDPMIMTWDEDAGSWFAPPVTGKICNHNVYQLATAPSGAIWAGCQWSGVYRSTDDGRTFEFVDVSALVAAQVPSYFPTRASGTDDVGAMYGLHIGPDGAIYFGTETGGVIYSTDDGATFRPLDQQPDDPMSPMARATNSGNVAGLGVTPDGRVLVQGVPGDSPYPPEDTVHFYVFDLAAQTTSLGVGFSDYFLGGQTVSQIVTMPSGEMFFHSNHSRVDPMTGTPGPGGIFSSTDGVTWTERNQGIDEIFMVPNMTLWVDGNGNGCGRSLAADGPDLYTITTSGKIFVLRGEGGGTTTSTTGDATAGTDSGAASTSEGGSASATGGAPTSSAATGASATGESGGSSDGATGGAGTDGGCACRSTDDRSPAALALTLLALLACTRRRERA